MHAWESLLDINSYLETISDKNKALWVVEYKGLIQGFFQVDFKDSVPFYRLNRYESLGTAVLQLNKTVRVECELMRKYL